jgi:hypothetical protein
VNFVEDPVTTATPAVQRVKPPLALVKLVNPAMRRILASPLHPLVRGHLLLLELTGRKTNRRYRIPVGYQDVDGRPTVFTNSPWRVNLRGGAEVTVTIRGARRSARASLEQDPETVARLYAEVIERFGWQAAQRRLDTKISVGRTPTAKELAEAVESSGLSIIRLDLT